MPTSATTTSAGAISPAVWGRRTNLDSPHSESYIDFEGEERCVTCDKWLEPPYYTIEDHQEAVKENDNRATP